MRNVETGAAAFLPDAQCLRSAAADVGLQSEFYALNYGHTTAIWDGQQLQASEGFWYPDTWQDSIRGWYRYGAAFRTIKHLVDIVQQRYSSFGFQGPNTANVRAMLKDAGLEDEAITSAEDYFTKHVERHCPLHDKHRYSSSPRQIVR